MARRIYFESVKKYALEHKPEVTFSSLIGLLFWYLIATGSLPAYRQGFGKVPKDVGYIEYPIAQ